MCGNAFLYLRGVKDNRLILASIEASIESGKDPDTADLFANIRPKRIKNIFDHGDVVIHSSAKHEWRV